MRGATARSLQARSLQARSLGARSLGAVAGSALALLGVVPALPATAAPAPAVPVAAAAPAGPVTVRVDPAACAAPSRDPAVRVVCTPGGASPHLIDGATLVLSPGRHAGPLDVRGRARVTVRGEPGAVLDAAGARYALALRDVRDVRVQSLTVEGGTAQTVWLERTRRVTVDDVTVRGGGGAGVQLRDTSRLTLERSRVLDAAAAGVMELPGVRDSTYRDLVVTGNGHGPAAYNGDGMQLSGRRVRVVDVVTSGNGSSEQYEHGIYVSAAARDVRLLRVRSSGNSGVAVKIAGSGTLSRSDLSDDRIALYCGPTAGPGWRVSDTLLAAPRLRQAEPGCRLAG